MTILKVFVLLTASLLAMVLDAPIQTNSAGASNEIFASGFEFTQLTTEQQLARFYAAQGGSEAFPDHYVATIETMLLAQDDVIAGDYTLARQRIDALVAVQPWSTPIWFDGHTLYDLNVGAPIAYYGMRMLDEIVETGDNATTGTLNMVALIAECATVTRPTLPDFDPETVQLEIHPDILANDAHVLYQATDLFRSWIKAITAGLEVNMTVVNSPGCTTVDFEVGDGFFVSYPDTGAMVDSLPTELINQTDLWWVVAPSGVPGDGSDFEETFITGGMGLYSNGAPLIVSDDAWFIRKPAHLGQGPYSEVERRLYHPQWFQHEFMHHLFRTWPQYELEDEPHQWFDRATWPDDFIGLYEPDYFAESITRRLLDADPPLAEGLKLPRFVDFNDTSLSVVEGRYTRLPIDNGFHDVTLTLVNGTTVNWTNVAGVSWLLNLQDGQLFTAHDSPYGVLPVFFQVDNGGQITQLIFQGESYIRQ